MITCATCGKEFKKRGGHPNAAYCSKACFMRGSTNVCPTCSKQFYARLSHPQTYCSKACLTAAQQARKVIKVPVLGVQAVVTCQRCGIEFKSHTGKANKYCSFACYRPSEALMCTCQRCGEPFRRTNGAVSRIYCSQECYQPDSKSTQPCARCGKEFHKNAGGRKKFCSGACDNADRASRNITRDCAFCGTPFTVNMASVDQLCCSLSCGQKRRLELQPSVTGYLTAKIAAGYRTDIEAMVEAVLQEFGILYLFEQKVGRFSADFLLPTLGIDLEADGWHHTHKVEHDAKRDAYLLAKGWQVIRLPDKTIRADARTAVIQALGLKPPKRKTA